MTRSAHDVRPSPIAGLWYPGHPHRLAESVDAMLAQADVAPIPGRLVGLLAPHAGHRYSGAVAGYAFRLAQSLDVDVVAVVGPSHKPYSAPVLTCDHAAFATPLGEVPVDHAALDAIRAKVALHGVRHDEEHALEIELPFLQRVLGDFRLIPLTLLDHSLTLAEQLGTALANVLAGQKALLVASSDLSHFYAEDIANQLDHNILDAVDAFDPAAVLRAEEIGQGFACGRGAIATVMFAAKALGADSAQVLHYATSAAVTGDTSRVVGYGAAAFFQAG